MYFFRKQPGFTLLELLVVIAIISILATALYASFSEARMQTRDKVRMTALKDVQLALERYKSQNGTYPLAGLGTCSANATEFAGPGPVTIAGFKGCIGNNTLNYIQNLAPEYINSLPLDPNSEFVNDKGFYYRSDGNYYKLMVLDSVESLVITSYNDKFARCPAAQASGPCSGAVPANTYAVYSYGAEDW